MGPEKYKKIDRYENIRMDTYINTYTHLFVHTSIDSLTNR